jgi:hypothetical protein
MQELTLSEVESVNGGMRVSSAYFDTAAMLAAGGLVGGPLGEFLAIGAIIMGACGGAADFAGM